MSAAPARLWNRMPAAITDPVARMAAAWNAGKPGRVLAIAAAAAGEVRNSEAFLALLGVAQLATSRCTETAQTFTRLVKVNPTVSAYWNNLGEAQRQAGAFDAAASAFARALELAPHDADVHYNLGLLHLQQRRWREARLVLLDAVRLAPGFVSARLAAARACHACGDNGGEAAMLEGAEAWPPQSADQALTLAALLSAQARPDAALQVLARAVVPGGADADSARVRLLAQRVAVYERSNRLDDAHATLRCLPLAALDALPADAIEARADGWRAHALLAARDHHDADAAALYRRVLEVAADPEVRIAAGFGLAVVLDRQGHASGAWAALQAAHAAQLEVVRDVAPELLKPDAQPLPLAAARVDARAFRAWRPLSAPPEATSPVFVIGFPRSGTTLVEQMLDAHPDFQSMDERGFIHLLIERMQQAGQVYPASLATLSQADADQLRALYWRLVARVLPARGRGRLIDKNPLNMLCLPVLQRLFPAAPIVLCLRHPCDVLLSCSMQSFRSPAFVAMGASLERLARGYADAFAQCCAHLDALAPRVLQWRYEAAVQDSPRELARLAQFLGIADAAPMLRFAEHARAKRYIATPSYAAVTRPIHGNSVGRWQHYREHFEPVLPILRPWLERFGYTE